MKIVTQSSTYTAQSGDTSMEADRKMMELYREMPSWKKVQLMSELIAATDHLALQAIRERYPQSTQRELQLRLASRRYERDLMVEAFDWDPNVQGY